MHRHLSLAAVLCLALALAPAAHAAPKLTSIGVSLTAPVASPNRSMIVMAPKVGSVQVLTSSGSRALAVPTSCAPAALSGDNVALRCAPTSGRSVALLDLADGQVRALQAPGRFDDFAPIALGARWLLATATLESDAVGHLREVKVLLDLTTGSTKELGPRDPYGARRYIDLDNPTPTRSRPRLAFAGQRLVVTALGSEGRWSVYRSSPLG
jgi:hypothetical protein